MKTNNYLSKWLWLSMMSVLFIVQTNAADTNVDGTQDIQFCVMKGTSTHEFPPTSETYSAFNPVPALARRTCEMFYQDNTCCTHQQTLAMQQSVLLETIDRNFVNCPACLSNIWGLWCGLICSPYQGNFVNVSTTHQDEHEDVVESLDFYVNRIYAEAIYDTCRNVHMSDEGITVHDKFPVYQEFFDWMLSYLEDFNVTIFYVDNEQASPPNFIGSISNCDKSCSCDDCEEACYPPPNINVSYNNTLPTIEMFNSNWSYLTLMLCMVYLSSMLIFFFVIGLWFPCVRYVQLRSRTLPVWICLGVVVIIIVLAITLSASLSDHSCTVEMFDSAWNCYTVIFVLILFGVLFVTPIVLSIYYYFALKHLGRLNDQATSWQAIDHQAAPTLRKKGLLQLYFMNHGQLCARHPMKVILLSFLITLALGAGIVYFQREVSPEGLWVDPQSRALKDQKEYEGIFGSECRKEQLIITSDIDSVSILDYNTLSLVLSIQQDIMSISVSDSISNKSYNYSDLCLKPYPQGGCLIESALEYWQSNANTLSLMKYNVEDHIKYCTTDPNQLTSGCLNTLGDPIDPRLVLGGFEGNDFQHATALLLTFFIDNNTFAEEWESKFLELASKEYSGIKVSYYAQSSLKNELLKVSETNEVIALVSYCVALLYIAIALGRLFPIQRKYVAVDSKFFLGIGAISIVIQSILIATGFCSYLGIKSTLFISVILPFLILAVGVDNIFVLVDTLENTDPSLQVEERISEALSHAGSSMAMASFCEALTFFLGAVTEMPAVKAFAIYSGTTILVNFVLQTTLFVAYLTLDLKRVEDNRVDCIPCIRVEDYNLYASDELAPLIKGVSRKKNKGVLRSFAEKYYGPFILHPIVKSLVVLSFLTLLLPGIYYATQLEVGLDQRDYLPQNNYIVNFMNKQDNVSTIGPLLWLVVKDYDYSNEDLQSEVCTVPGCNRNGLMNLYQYAPFFSNNDIPHSWINSYLEWAASPTCCMVDFSTGSTCQGSDDCEPCVSLTDNNRPLPSQFYPYVQTFLSSQINSNSCNISGSQYFGDVIMDNPSKISASRFRYYYSPLLSQSDYINAIRVTYELIDNSQIPGAIAFSDFFIYYGQFMDIKVLALQNLMIALAGVFFITFCIMGNPSVSLAITVVVAMIEIDVLGAMQIWNLKLNPVSLVNLLMAMGISIEFCVHIGYAFTRSQGRRHDRAYRAIVEMFPVVFSGISMFKLLLVIVLGVTSGQIFKVYYFSMYCFMLVLGVTHSLVFLPVFLSLVGTDTGALCLPQQYKSNLSGVISSKRIIANNSGSGNVSIQTFAQK